MMEVENYAGESAAAEKRNESEGNWINIKICDVILSNGDDAKLTGSEPDRGYPSMLNSNRCETRESPSADNFY